MNGLPHPLERRAAVDDGRDAHAQDQVRQERDAVGARGALPHRGQLVGRVAVELHPRFGKQDGRVPEHSEEEGRDGGQYDADGVHAERKHLLLLLR
jgi:hypothetical protein